MKPKKQMRGFIEEIVFLPHPPHTPEKNKTKPSVPFGFVCVFIFWGGGMGETIPGVSDCFNLKCWRASTSRCGPPGLSWAPSPLPLASVGCTRPSKVAPLSTQTQCDLGLGVTELPACPPQRTRTRLGTVFLTTSS